MNHWTTAGRLDIHCDSLSGRFEQLSAVCKPRCRLVLTQGCETLSCTTAAAAVAVGQAMGPAILNGPANCRQVPLLICCLGNTAEPGFIQTRERDQRR